MTRRAKVGIVAAVVGLSLLLLCLCVATWVAYVNFAPVIASAANPKVDRIAYVDNDSNIQLVDATGTQRVALTTDASETAGRYYIFPTWAPDSQRIAFIGALGTDQSREGELFTLPVKGGDRAIVYKSSEMVPFYSYWSPDSQRIAFLAQNDTEMVLLLGHPEGKQDVRKVESGAPFYWDWAPNSQSLLMHIGGSRHDSNEAHLAIQGVSAGNAPKALDHGPSDFEAPHYSPNGAQILYAGTHNSDGDALFVADAQGTNARLITDYVGRIAFAWSPDGKKIAWIVTDVDSGLPHLGQVMVSDADGSNAKPLAGERTLAFYWSPDSQQIAYLTVVIGNSRGCADDCGRLPGLGAPLLQAQTVHLRWRVVNLADNQVRTLATFDPTQTFLLMLPYFDQYSRSTTFWSPDSHKFVYTQEEADGSGTVWVADVTGKEEARKVGDGTLGVWSWK
ncbi:MAG: PD40 domain-containing protein [Chloroflexi bacterium]|nr:PD40 domain-containing protein [Chloroflexota bacterium]